MCKPYCLHLGAGMRHLQHLFWALLPCSSAHMSLCICNVQPHLCILLSHIVVMCVFYQLLVIDCFAPACSCRHLKDLLADQARCEALTE